MRVLLIEADCTPGRSLEIALHSRGFSVYVTDRCEEGLELAKLYEYDIILVDTFICDMTCDRFLRAIRDAKVKTGIIVLGTTSPSEAARLLNAGADDCIARPLHTDEVVARLHAVIRRYNGHIRPQITVGIILVDLVRRSVKVREQELALSDKEYEVFELLALRQGVTQTKENFINYLYGGRDEPNAKVVDVRICKLRSKLRKFNADDYIQTVWGKGYKLSEPAPKQM